MAPVATPVFPGQVVAGKYRVERVLGEGGHGVVVAATHLVLGDKVAIKVLRPDYASDREVVARFLREARAAVRIKGEHVTRVLDVGAMEDGTPYMVMEHLSGHDLGQVLDARSRLPVALAVDYVLQTCEALAEAHGIGIVHRDVKPENLFLTRRADGTPWIKVLDFGISKAVAHGTDQTANFTQTQNVVGSPQYMAPEQMQNPKLIDLRTDVWGIGATLYELLAGEPPFTAATLPEIFARILRDPPPPINRNDIPPELSAVIARCLEKDIEKRYPSVAELARALVPFSPSSGDVAERINRVGVIAFQSGARLPATSSHDVMAAFEPAPKRKTGLIVGLVFAGVALGSGAIGLVMVRRRPPVDVPVTVGEPSSSSEPEPTPPAPPPPAPAPVVTEAASVASVKKPAVVGVVAGPRPKPSASVPAPATRPTGVASSRYD